MARKEEKRGVGAGLTRPPGDMVGTLEPERPWGPWGAETDVVLP